MKTYPARFVGELGEVNYPFDDFVPNVGDVALIMYPLWADECGSTASTPRFAHLLIRCACGDVDKIPVLPTEGGWTLTSRDPVHIAPSVLVRCGEISRCHYFVHGGQLQMLDDTTSRLR